MQQTLATPSLSLRGALHASARVVWRIVSNYALARWHAACTHAERPDRFVPRY